MSIYKVLIEKTVFVRAENKEEAEEMALEDITIMTDERIVKSTKSSRRDIQNLMFGVISNAKTELIEKIIKAKLTQEEIREVIEFAETLKAKRSVQK